MTTTRRKLWPSWFNMAKGAVMCLFSNIKYLLNNKIIYNFWIIGLRVSKDKARNTWRAMVMKERHESDMARTREIQKMDKHCHGMGGRTPPPPPPMPPVLGMNLNSVSIKYFYMSRSSNILMFAQSQYKFSPVRTP
jgi:hypothetical protein